MTTAKLGASILIAGWLANALAAKDSDVEAGIEAYENGAHDEALARFDAARERRPERAELSFNRGLVLLALEDKESARTAFETASESDEDNVRASALYELGNLALDEEDHDGAIQRYIDCLKARPDHANAKWNLELARLLKKKKEEEEEEQDQEEQDQEDQDQEDQDQEDQDQEDQDQEDQDQEDEQKEDEPQEDQDQEDEQKEDEPQEDEQKEDEPQEDETAAPQPREIDEMDVQKALEQLDEQDPFTLDRPAGGYVPPEKDW